MKMATIICATCAGPVLADQITCDMAGTSVAFAIDRAQFAPPVDAQEPAQRRITTVQMGDATFPAEPILIGDLRGFWAEGLGGSEAVLMIQGNGTATYANTREGTRLTGTCEVQP